MLVVLAPWRAGKAAATGARAADTCTRAQTDESLDEVLARVLARWPVDRPRRSRHCGLLLVDALPVPALFAVLSAVLRGQDWACGVFLRPPADPRFAATRLIQEARRSPWGVAVRRDPTDPAVRNVHAALGPYATLLRQRSPAVWTAVDAVARHGTATAAAAELGCAQQTISRHLAKANLVATGQTRVVVEALLAAR